MHQENATINATSKELNKQASMRCQAKEVCLQIIRKKPQEITYSKYIEVILEPNIKKECSIFFSQTKYTQVSWYKIKLIYYTRDQKI